MDSSGNIATGYTGTVHFTDSVSGETLPDDYTFTAGDAGYHAFEGVRLTMRGSHRVTVTDSQDSSIVGTVIIDVA
jgi:hypothetical protein